MSTLAAMRTHEPVLEKIDPGQKVSALEILVAASEEPDHGLDVGLWQDNKTWYGAQMGLGTQPFGNPTLWYSSQAPFHMGFFHESVILYWAAGWISRCYPEYRIDIFQRLSRLAFSTGHPYWGYRFLGWSLHTIQDLTQPYHATLAPGVSLPKLLWISLLEIIGIKKPAEDMRQLLTNRHLALENYQFESMRARTNNRLLAALSDTSPDQQYRSYDSLYPRDVITTQAHSHAAEVDLLLTKALPRSYVNEPSYEFTGTDPSINLLEISHKHDHEAANMLDDAFLSLMRAFGTHTRNVVQQFVTPPKTVDLSKTREANDG